MREPGHPVCARRRVFFSSEVLEAETLILKGFQGWRLSRLRLRMSEGVQINRV